MDADPARRVDWLRLRGGRRVFTPHIDHDVPDDAFHDYGDDDRDDDGEYDDDARHHHNVP
jgi:hypothetical protein